MYVSIGIIRVYVGYEDGVWDGDEIDDSDARKRDTRSRESIVRSRATHVPTLRFMETLALRHYLLL